MKILSFTSLYPNASQINHGIFVENRLRHLVAAGNIDLEVMAPVPWFPFRHQMFGKYAAFAGVPRSETRHNIPISHPRYPVIPRFGMTVAPGLMARALLGKVQQAVKQRGGIDLIDAHYYYPDGVAAVRIGQKLGIPVVVTARGTDINTIPLHDAPRRQIIEATHRAAATITVSQALKHSMVELGCDGGKIHVLRNGVDLTQFRPVDREPSPPPSNAKGPVILSVGTLNRQKGHHLVIEALKVLPGATLLIAGAGDFEDGLRKLAGDSGLAERVTFLGRIPHHDLPALYSAADILVLASASEGWPNVLLEAMACGTPVAATNVGGIAEVITGADAGQLIPDRTPAAIAATLRKILDDPPERSRTRSYAEQYSWDDTNRGQIELFREVIRG